MHTGSAEGRPAPDAQLPNAFSLDKRDVLPFLALLATAILFTFERLSQGLQLPYVTGDAAVYASQAAGMLWPENFGDDFLLSRGWSITPAWMVLFFPITVGLFTMLGDYSVAFSIMNPPLIFLQGLGFYLLGRWFFGSRYLALLAAFACFIPVDGTYWYVQKFALGRTWFSALYPFLLLMFLRFAPNPRNWAWIMFAAGLGMYVHPVSAPAVGFAVFVGLLAFRPHAWTWSQTLVRLFLCGLAFLAATSPFFIINMFLTVSGPIHNYEEFLRVRSWSGNAFVSVGHYLSLVFSFHAVLAIIGCGIAGGWAAWRFRFEDRKNLAFLIYCTLGLAGVTTLIPLIEIELAKAVEIRPQLEEVPRAIRYIMPNAVFLALAGVIAFINRGIARREESNRPRHRPVRPANAVATVLIVLYGMSANLSPSPPYVFAWYQFVPFLTTLHCWKRGNIRCTPPVRDTISDMLDHLRQNYPQGTRVLPFVERYNGAGVGQDGLSAIIRYAAKLPVRLSFHDELLPFYGPVDKDAHVWRYVDWRGRFLSAYHGFTYVTLRPFPPLQQLTRIVNADVIITDLALMDWQIRAIGRVTFKNDTFTVIDVRGGGKKSAP